MKRDMDLIRAILMLVEDAPAGQLIHDFSSLNEGRAVIAEHIWLAQRGGLVEAIFSGGSPSDGECVVTRLTPAGHDFLAQAEKPGLWAQAKDTAAKAGVGLTIDVMKTLLTEAAKAALKAHILGS